MFQELERVLLYPRMLRRSGLTPDEIAGFLWDVIERADIVRPSAVPDGLMRDPTDHHVLGAALAAERTSYAPMTSISGMNAFAISPANTVSES
jgi:hypothetical protein